MYPVNPEGTQVIVGSMNMGYISDTARNRTHNLFRLKREPIPLYHSDGHNPILQAHWTTLHTTHELWSMNNYAQLELNGEHIQYFWDNMQFINSTKVCDILKSR